MIFIFFHNGQPSRTKPTETIFPSPTRFQANREEGLDPEHDGLVLSRMERDVFPIIGNRKSGEIAPTDILDMIRLVEARGALDIARRLKQNVSQVFRLDRKATV